MDDDIKLQYSIYLDKIKIHTVKTSWIIDNLPKLYNYIIGLEGSTISEKIYLIENDRGICKVCGGVVKFLSHNRGYRVYCSKKCSNGDDELISEKKLTYKNTCLNKWGFENSSQSEIVREKIVTSKKSVNYDIVNQKLKKTFLEKWGVDNPSKLETVKEKKKNTNIEKFGVENPFQSEVVKNKIKESNIQRYGFSHPLKSEEIKNKLKLTNIEKWGVDNYTKTTLYKELMYEKWRGSQIKTNLNSEIHYKSYLGLGKHQLMCDLGGDHTYVTNSSLYHARRRINNAQCTVCYPVNDLQSVKELEIYNFIKSIYSGDVTRHWRDSLEIDIYLPELNIGFEFNGLYWHSELFKDKNYHLNKTNYFEQRGIRIIHIWEDDWMYKNDIIRSQIKNWIGLSNNRIYARNCEIREVNSIGLYRDFLEKNHIQGFVPSSIRIGLFYGEELISLMTFDHFEGRKKMSESEWNLSRFCNKLETNVVGGASKILSYFIKQYQPTRIISFADKSWSSGQLYNKLGFCVKSVSYPNYSYLIDGRRSNKQKWKKSNLMKMGFNSNFSESKIMEDNFGSYKIFDCGQIKFELLLKNEKGK